MALVRCEIHKIPYNDENPRGCPACAREKEGADQTNVMQELAKASRTSSATVIPPAPAEKKESKELAPGALWRQSLAQSQSAIEAPDISIIEEGTPGRFSWLSDNRRRLTVGWVIIGVLAITLFLTAGPGYVEAPHPPEPPSEARILTVQPFAPITTVFSIMGPQAPQAVPGAQRLARYSYGSDLYIDALNARVYAITLEVGSRTWRGLQVGMPERAAEGTLSLLGQIQRQEPTGARSPQEIGGYTVYPSLENRPTRTLLVEVRPPNGCFDVSVDLQPRASGILRSGGERYAVIGEGSNAPHTWVVTRIRITTRRVSGPHGPVTC
jgi:hypothetical protein